MTWTPRRFRYIAFTVAILVITVLLPLSLFAQKEITPDDIVRTAWQNAQMLGSYHFNSDIEQITYPAASLRNVGRSPMHEYLSAKGTTDSAAQRVELSLQSGATPGQNGENQVDVRIEQGQGYVRQAGGDWQPSNDVSNLLTPSGDPLGFVRAIKNVKLATAGDAEAPTDTRSAAQAQHFTFDLDAEAFANYSRDQLEAALRGRGELPAGVVLQASDFHRQMAGSGEIWIDADGLPTRLIVEIAFPPGKSGDQVAATINSNFHGFDRQRLTPISSALTGLAQQLALPQTAQAWVDLSAGLALLLVLSCGAMLFIRFRTSQKLYAATVITVILATLITPLLQAQQLYAFSEKMEQRADAANQKATPATIEGKDNLPQLLANARGQNESAVQSSPNAPTANPLNAPILQTSNNGPDSDGDGLSDSTETELGSNPNDADSDDDTLNDGIEVLKLGTNPLQIDSDGDGLNDPKEVAGFVVNGAPWYTSPSDEDSNNDGMLDGADCIGQTGAITPAVACADTDGDGTPDIFDEDNDGDLVPDSVDLSPFTQRGQSTPYGKNSPFALRANGLNPNKPLYVNLQLRPKTASHLASALNVLDWPAHDSQGNIRRYLDTTFANTANLAIRSEDANAGNGDIRIVPMISVRIPKQAGSFGNLPVKAGAAPITAASTITDFANAIDQSKLDAYGMSVLKADANTLEVLTPATIESDPNGDARVAFSSHMLYQSSADGSWGADHEVRLLWIVQMIIDVCNNPKQEGEAFCDIPANRHDELTVLQTYVDDFYVAAVTIEEQHGLDIDIIYEDPVNDPNTSYDNYLWHIGFGLMNTFANGSDENNDGRRDLTIDEIHRRWGTTTATDEDRWQVPLYMTGVKQLHFDHPDFVATVMMTETKRLLNSAFLVGSTPLAAAPTLLFARERALRSSALDPASTATAISFTGAPVQRFADLSWAPYRYEYDNGWQSYPIADYMAVMRQRLNSDSYFTPTNSSTESQIEAHDRLTLASGLYLQLYHGYSNIVERDTTPLVTSSSVTQQDLATQQSGSMALAMYQLTRYASAGLKGIYTIVKSTIALRPRMTGVDSTVGGLAVGAIVASALVIIYSEEGADSQAARISTATVGAIGIVGAAYTASRMIQLYRAASVAGSASQAASNLKILVEKNKTGKVGLLIGVAIAWGMYAYGVLGDGKDADDPQLLSQAVAMTVFVILMFIISSVPIVGAAIQLFFLIFDGLAMLICGISGQSGGICGGLTGLIVGALASLFYDVNMFVDMEDTERLRIDYVRPEIVDPNMGVIAGNSLSFSVGFTNALKPAGSFVSQLSGGLVDENDIRKSTFVHSLSLTEEKLETGLDLGQMSGEWTADWNLQRYTRYTALNTIFPLGIYGTGVNVPYRAYLNEGYIVPYEECFVFLFIRKCKTHSISGSNSINISEAVVYDILPDTFDKFAALRQIDNAYVPAWGNSGSDFPPLVDADGDGLRSMHVGGSDPNDSKWDTDGDGLSDLFEQGWGSRADVADSDGDGLLDGDELRYGTNPNRADSDFDGLSDKQELDGWEFIYGFNGTQPLRTWVRSDPTQADPDHDDILDNQERRFGFHPLVASENIVMNYAAALKNPSLPTDLQSTKVYARGGQTLNYDAEIGNALNNRHIFGQLLTQGESAFSLNTSPQSFFLLPLENITRTTPISVSSGTTSGVYRVSQQARGYVDDPRTPTQQAIAYWSFDNDRPLIDLSGALPSTNLLCTEPNCPALVSAGKIGSGMDYTQGFFDRMQAQGLVEKLGGASNYSIGGWLYPQNHNLSGNPLTFFAFNTSSNGSIHAVRYDISIKKFTYVDPIVGTVTSSRTFEMNQWHYVMVVIRNSAGNNGTLYVDGVPEATFTTTSRPSANALFHIGNQVAGAITNYRWYGKIDEVKVFNRALTADEATDAMEAIEPVMDSAFDTYKIGANNQVSYYDRQGTKTVTDCSSNCPSFLETPWGSGVHAGQLLIDFSPFTSLKHTRYSIALWVKPVQQPSNTWADFLGWLSPSSYGAMEVPAVGYDAGGRLRAYFDPNNTLVTAPVLQLGKWHHIIVSYDGTTLTLYVNGQSVGSTTSLAGNLNATDGGLLSLNTFNDFAYVDELQLYNYVLSSNQVKRIYSGEWYKELQLRFEDPPGASRFANDANRGADAFCNLAANQCPISNVAGRTGAAAQFPDSGRLLSVKNTTATPPMVQATAAAWVKGSGTILSRANDMDIVFSNTSVQIRAVDVTGSVRVTTTRTLNIPLAQQPNPATWNHIAVTFSGVAGATIDGQGVSHPYAQIHLYVNGQEVAADLNGPRGQLLGSSNAWQIGSGFVGDLDDVRLYRKVFTAAEIQSLYQASAPSLWLKLDEAENATSFVDSAGNFANATCTSCPASGRKGQLGVAAQFDGNDFIQAAPANQLALGGVEPFSLAAWVKPERFSGYSTIIAKSLVPNPAESCTAQGCTIHATGYWLGLNNDKLNLSRPNFSDYSEIEASQPLPANVWSFVAATYDGNNARLYINGQLAVEASGWLTQATNVTTPLLVAAEAPSGSPLNFFQGRIDDVTLFKAALSSNEINQIYQDQFAWVEERSRFEVTVDNDPPTTTIRSTLLYRMNQPEILDVYANDATSPLNTVELLTNGQAAAAPLCAGTEGNSAYCPTFTPNGEGRYTLQSRVRDVVGNQSSSSVLNVLVDATAPTVTLTTSLSALLQPMPHPSQLQRWVLSLAGTITEPNLSSGDAGSGIRTLQLTIYDADNKIIGAGTQPVSVPVSAPVSITVNGPWQHDYLFFEKPDGLYRIEAQVSDKAGNQRTIQLGTVRFDGRAPTAAVTTLLASDVISDPIAISGVVSDTVAGSGTVSNAVVSKVEIAYVPSDLGSPQHNTQPLPALLMHLPMDDDSEATTAHDISGNGNLGVCSNCPAFGTKGYQLNAATFDGVNDTLSANTISAGLNSGALSMGAFVYVAAHATDSNSAILAFNSATGDDLNRLHYYPSQQRFGYYDPAAGSKLSSDSFAPGTWHHLFVTIDSANQAILYVDGRQQISFSTSVRPTAISRFSIGQEWDGDTASDFFAGQIDEVQLYNRALSSSEVRQLAQGAAPVLWLDFEDKWATNSITLTDRSGWQHPILLSGNHGGGDNINKSMVGGVGDFALHFDGIEDRVDVPSHAALDLSHGEFSEAVWVRPEGGNTSSGRMIVGYRDPANPAKRYPSLFVVNDFQLGYGFGDGVNDNIGFTDSALTTDSWNFVAATYDGTSYKIYVNGQLIKTDSTFAGRKPYPIDHLQLGSMQISGAAAQFHGGIDELRIYPRAISEMEIQALYRQGWQSVSLATQSQQTSWSTSVPNNMEGLFTIELRASDSVGNVSKRQSLWRGVIDNVAPRITLINSNNLNAGANLGTGNSFMASASALPTIEEYRAEDFNLSSDHFSTRCGIGQIDQESDFEADWHLAFSDEAAGSSSRLYQASASCAQGSTLGFVNACDIYGNCTMDISTIPALPEVSIDNVTVNEASASAIVTVSLNQSRTWDVKVDYWTSDGSAQAGNDYTAVTTSTLSIAAGELDGQIVVPINNDSLHETSEAFTVQITNPVNAVISNSIGTVTIIDNDLPPALSAHDVTVDEAAGSALVSVTLSAVSGLDATFDYATSPGSALTPTDFSTITGSATIPAGALGITLSVPISNDLLDELDEDFTLSVSNPQSATVAVSPATVTILDNDASPELAINDVTVNEGDGTATFSVTLSAVSGLEVQVDAATSDGSAHAGDDYRAVTDTLTIPPGSTSATITLPLIDDTLDELAETFTVTLSNAVNASISDGSGSGTIVDNDGPPALFVDNITIDEAAGSAIFTVSLSTASGLGISLDSSTLDGSAVAGEDYNAQLTSTVTISAGALSAQIAVTITDDLLDEDAESFILLLGNPGNASLDNSQATATILDNDDLPSLSIGDVTVDEAVGSATFTVTLSPVSGRAVTVNFGSDDDSALSLSDYTAVSGTLNLAAGETTATFTVQINDDEIDELDETFNLHLSSPLNATLADGTAIGTILDNDASPTLTIADATSDEDAPTVTMSVTLNTVSGLDVSVAYSTSASSANAGSDFVASTGVITLPAGTTVATLTIPLLADRIDELTESFEVLLLSPLNATFADAAAVVALLDNDSAEVIVADSVGGTVSEAGATSSYSIALDSTPLADVTVTITPDGQLDLGAGGAMSITLTFHPLDALLAQTVTVHAVDDYRVEGLHTGTIQQATQSADPLYAAMQLETITMTIADNDSAAIVVEQAAVLTTTESGGAFSFGVKLNSEPASSVAISLTSSNPNEGLPTPAALHFSPQDWNVAQVITVTGVDDEIDDGNQPYAILLAPATSADSDYRALDADDVGNILNLDDDTLGFEAEISGTTSENGITATLRIRPTSQPTATVTIPVTTSDFSEGIAEPESLRFNASNWQDFQSVVISGVDDTVIDGDVGYQLLLGNAISDDRYQGYAFAPINLVNSDNDLAYQLSANGPMTITEGDVISLSFTVTRTGAITTEASSIQVVVSGTAEIEVGSSGAQSAGAVLHFAKGQANATFTVTVADDAVVESNETVAVSLANAEGGGNAILPSQPITTFVINNDSAAVQPNVPDNLVVGQAGTLSYTLVLDSQPTAPVTIVLTPSAEIDLGNGVGEPIVIHFDATNWNQPAIIQAQIASQNGVTETSEATIQYQVSSDDPFYDGLVIAPLTIRIGDNNQLYSVYLPVVSAQQSGPDLIVDSVIAQRQQVVVVIRNIGNEPVPLNAGFWVNLYINPQPAPQQVNQVWYDGRSSQGIEWGVDGAILRQLVPGGTLQLAVGDPYEIGNSNFSSIANGSQIYVQVDAAHTASTYGGVLESHEKSGGAYNNIIGPLTAPALQTR